MTRRYGRAGQPVPLCVTCARFCCRLAVSCPRLGWLYLHSTAATSRAVVAALKAADLGWLSDSDWPRTIVLWLPGR